MKKKILAIILALILVLACVLVVYTISQKTKDVADNKAETNQTEVEKDGVKDAEDEGAKEESTPDTGAIMSAEEFEKKVDEVNDPSISEERKEELLAEIQAFLEQVEQKQQ